jgi:hypothetical protein
MMLLPFLTPPVPVIVMGPRWPAGGDHAKNPECRYYRRDRAHDRLLVFDPMPVGTVDT